VFALCGFVVGMSGFGIFVGFEALRFVCFRLVFVWVWCALVFCCFSCFGGFVGLGLCAWYGAVFEVFCFVCWFVVMLVGFALWYCL